MKATVDLLGPRFKLDLSHGNEEPVSFSLNVFQKDSFKVEKNNNYDVLGEINRYWASLPQYRQEEIWDVYVKLHHGFDEIFDADELNEHVESCISRLYQLHPLESLRRFLERDPGVQVPKDVNDKFDPTKDGHTPGKTYVTDDYWDLAAFSLFLRTIMPAIGEYVESTRREVGVQYKEFEALKRIRPCGVLDTSAIDKLRSYISAISANNVIKDDQKIAGFSSEDAEFLSLALVVVRRLCVADLRGSGEGRHLAALVYNFIFQLANPSKAAIPFKEKPVLETGREDNNRSTMEAYRKRTEMSYGEIAGFEYGYKDLIGTAIRLAPDISEDDVLQSAEAALVLVREGIGQPQISLMNWVFKTVHAVYTPDYIPVELLAQNLGVAQAVMWHWGHKYLACLMTASPVSENEGVMVATADSRGQIPKELQEEIYHYYPYVWRNARKGKNMETDPHPVIHEISMLTDEIMGTVWKTNIRDDRLIETFGSARRRLPLVPTLRADIASLIVDIERRRK